MNGADRIYRLVRLAETLGLDGLTKDYRGYGVNAIRRGNIVLVAGEHARGRTCHVFLENGDDRLEVYGVTGGQRGWNEEYGWLTHGNWVSAIEQLQLQLDNEIQQALNERNITSIQRKAEEATAKANKVQRFNDLFA